MKKVLLIIFCLVSLITHAQKVAPSVAGVKFGTPFEEVKHYLEQKFRMPYESGKGKISYYEVTIGGLYFDFAIFDFVYKERLYRLNEVALVRDFTTNDWRRAEETINMMKNTLSKKYKVVKVETRKHSYFLYMPSESNTVFMPMLLSMNEWKSQRGEWRIYVGIYYGPYYPKDIKEIDEL